MEIGDHIKINKRGAPNAVIMERLTDINVPLVTARELVVDHIIVTIAGFDNVHSPKDVRILPPNSAVFYPIPSDWFMLARMKIKGHHLTRIFKK